MEFGILHHQYPLHVPTTYSSTSMSVQLSYDSLLRNSDMPGGATALTAQVWLVVWFWWLASSTHSLVVAVLVRRRRRLVVESLLSTVVVVRAVPVVSTGERCLLVWFLFIVYVTHCTVERDFYFLSFSFFLYYFTNVFNIQTSTY